MKSVIDTFGKVVIINETREESLATIKDIFEELGVKPPSDKELTADWGIIGGETNAQLYEWANDYASELHTEKCAAKNEWRYNN